MASESEPIELSGADAEARAAANKSWTTRYWLRAQEMGIVKTCVWLILTIVYQTIGAWLYTSIEGENDTVVRLERFNAKKEALIERENWIESLFQNMTGGGWTYETIDDILEESIIHYEGLFNKNFMVEPEMAVEGWGWLNSMFFCNSLYTSIGFGNRLYPKTTLGMCFTMIYSFIGVPFMLAMTGDLGLVVFEGLYWCWLKYKIYSTGGLYADEAKEENIIIVDDEDDEKKPPKIKTVEMIERDKKEYETYPVYLGLLSSVISLVICSGLVLIYEPTWTYNVANYYFVTSFLLIGLGDVTPSAPEAAEEFTLIPHILLLQASITFIGMVQHVISRRVEYAYVNIGYNIHMEYRAKQVEPDISIMKANEGPIAEDNKLSLLIRKLGFAENFFYGSMDRSRKGLLHHIWHRKANMKNKANQTNLPMRDIALQHLVNVNEETDCENYGEQLFDVEPPKQPEMPDGRIPYLYNCE